MGFFDRKREVLSDPEPEPAPQPKPAAAPAPAPQPKVQVQPQPAPQPAPPPEPASPPKPDFGIQKAIELMRKLPADNIPLVVSVVRTTLESTDVDVEQIIDDAKDKRDRIAKRIVGLKDEIADFEEEIAARREEIAALEADGAETKTVQERLEMAMKGTSVPGPPMGGRAPSKPSVAAKPSPPAVAAKASMEKAALEDPVPKPPF